jgi:hypothetical protein
MGALLKGVTFRKADISFDKTYELDLGGVKVTLWPGLHTHRATRLCGCRMRKDGVIFAGDGTNRTVVGYSQYSSTKAWMDALAMLAACVSQRR